MDKEIYEILKHLGIVEIENNVKYWLVRTASGTFFKDFYNNNYISIGWDEISDIDFITKQLENYPNQTANNTSSESKFLAKVRSNNNARPIFKTNFERYEWHIKNGCIDINDKIWLANYIKSNEFKSIYK